MNKWINDKDTFAIITICYFLWVIITVGMSAKADIRSELEIVLLH